MASSIEMFTGLGVGFYTFGILFRYLTDEFGWSRTAISSVRALYSVAVGATSPLFGRLTDIYGPRWIMVSGAAMMGGAFIF